jgi:serine/threonine protein kinase/tetratricopeptide (TPR) repeat protein
VRSTLTSDLERRAAAADSAEPDGAIIRVVPPAESRTCPSEDAIAAFLGDELGAAEREALERHMDRCSACQAVVAGMIRVFAGSRIATTGPDGSVGHESAPTRSLDPLPPGATIGRYRLVAMVGIGGMGIVYAAEDPELQRRVAVKVLRTQGQGDVNGLSQRLLREARALAKLSHPNVIPVYDVGTWNDRVFVAMEFVDGWTLGKWLAEHPRTWTSIAPMVLAAGRGLAAAHEAGFVHRDLKPDNILVSRSGRVFVTDFGLARWAEATTVQPSATSPTGWTIAEHTTAVEAQESTGPGPGTGPGSDAHTQPEPFATLTRSGAFVGTPAYMAPEQFAAQHVGAAADQFAFCVVVWEALFGKRPFEGRTLGALAHAVCEADPPPFPSGVHVPRPVKAALLRGLAKRPEDRHPSMAALLHALEPTRRAWVPWTTAGTVAAVSVAATLLSTKHDASATSAPCSNLPGLAQEWSEARRTAIAAAFTQTGARYAESTSARAIAELDTYAQAWASRELEICEAQQQGSVDLGRTAMRLDCLDRSRELFASIVDGLEQADVALVDRAVRVVTGLPDLGICVDDARLVAESKPVPPPERSAEVEAVRAALLEADAELQLGRYDAGLQRLDAEAERTGAIGFQPLVAELAYTRGRLLSNLARNDEAAVELERAELEATASRHAQIAAKALIVQLYVMGRRRDAWPTIAAMVKRAEAAGQAARLSPGERASLHTNAAVGAYYAGELEIAEAQSKQALELIDRDAEPLRWASASLNLASFMRKRGAIETAVPTIRAVIDVYTAQLGRVHPDVAEAYRELAISLKNLERYDEARQAAQTSLEITAEAMGETHYTYGGALSTRSGIEGAAGEYAEALALAERSIDVLGAANQPTQIPESQKAEWLIALGRPDEAAPIVDALMAAEVQRRGADSPSTAWIWFVRCSLESKRRDVDATRAACDRAVALTGAEPGSDDELSLELDRAVYLAEAGAGEAAITPLQALLPRVEDSPATPTTARIFRELGERSWTLPGSRARARAWMERAHAQFVALGLTETAAEVKLWLDAHAP